MIQQVLLQLPGHGLLVFPCRPGLLASDVLRDLQVSADIASLHDGQRGLKPWDAVPLGRTVRVLCRVSGGKGGYGNQLRALGRKGGITDNLKECRNLNGNRVRDVQAAESAEQWVASQAERDAAKSRVLQEKAEQRRLAHEHYQQDISERAKLAVVVDEVQILGSVAKGLERAMAAKCKGVAAPVAAFQPATTERKRGARSMSDRAADDGAGPSIPIQARQAKRHRTLCLSDLSDDSDLEASDRVGDTGQGVAASPQTAGADACAGSSSPDSTSVELSAARR